MALLVSVGSGGSLGGAILGRSSRAGVSGVVVSKV